ncbi:MAG: hypothetical protein KGL62_04145 [Bradyrhizobium sp.]|nr:hypothetical protein [Bradyrhizobium sp.]
MNRSVAWRMLFGAVSICTVLTTGMGPSPARAQLANNTPLAFGMNVEEASAALGTTLVYVRGRPGNEIFLALPDVKGSTLSDRRDGLYLQFRRGKLDGWKGDWGTSHPCCR